MLSNSGESLCLECGLCCNGVIFSDVKLQAEDDAFRLRRLGLSVASPSSGVEVGRFRQPCSALDGCRCTIYADRPKYCREFECLVLKGFRRGRLQAAGAL